MGLTVADLVADPTLDTRLVAGGDGLGRPVTWAHTCDTADPERWLGPHELLMTMGGCVPVGADAQRRLIASLDEAGLAGMTVGEEVVGPRYTRALREEADRRAFPVLHTGPDTPFAALGRTVAAAGADQRTTQLTRLSRLYSRATTSDLGRRRLGTGLEDILGTAVRVVDDATGSVVIGTGGAPAEGGWHSRPLRTRRPSHLLVRDRARLDAFLLVHVAQVLEVDANAILDDAEREAKRRGDLLSGWLGDPGLEGAASDLRELWGADRGPFRVLATTTSDRASVHLGLALGGLPVLSLDDGAEVLVACLDRDLDRLRKALAPLVVSTGVSAPHRGLADVGSAVAEATTALRTTSAGAAWQVFDDQRLSMLARSRREAQGVIDHVLGDLAGDDARAATLRTTLFAFLDLDLRWQHTADHLGIHRQTLVYRIRQAEIATGRDVRTTSGISELWLARTAWAQYAPRATSGRRPTGARA